LFWKVDTHIKRGFPPFPLSHSVVSWYSYPQRQFSDLNRCCHSLVDLPKYGTTRIIHDNVCSDNCHLGKDMIICGVRTMKWLHSPCHREFWYFHSRFNSLFTSYVEASKAHHHQQSFFSCEAHFFLSTMCVHNPPMCASHCDSSTCYCIWEAFLISFSHYN